MTFPIIILHKRIILYTAVVVIRIFYNYSFFLLLLLLLVFYFKRDEYCNIILWFVSDEREITKRITFDCLLFPYYTYMEIIRELTVCLLWKNSRKIIFKHIVLCTSYSYWNLCSRQWIACSDNCPIFFFFLLKTCCPNVFTNKV